MVNTLDIGFQAAAHGRVFAHIPPRAMRLPKRKGRPKGGLSSKTVKIKA
jgi:hypothetical protein